MENTMLSLVAEELMNYQAALIKLRDEVDAILESKEH